MDVPGWYKKGMQCPKHTQKFADGGSCPSFDAYEGAAWSWHGYKKFPVALSLCEADAKSMQQHGYPFMLSPMSPKNDGGTNDKSAYAAHPQGSAGSGYLMYDTSANRWTGVW